MLYGNKNAFSSDWLTLSKWAIPNKGLQANVNKNRTNYLVRSLVKQLNTKEKLRENSEYNLLGVRLAGNGSFIRETLKGSDIEASSLSKVKTGDFIYSRLFAWRGAFSIIPPEQDGSYVSNEFPLFEVNESIVLREYLYLYFIQQPILKEIQRSSVGSAAVSRNRLKEDVFLDYEISIPPLSEQEKIIDIFRKSRRSLTEHNSKLKDLVEKVNSKAYDLYYSSTKKDILSSRDIHTFWNDLPSWDVKSARAKLFKQYNPSFIPLSTYCSEATHIIKPKEIYNNTPLPENKNWSFYGVSNKLGVFHSYDSNADELTGSYKKIEDGWFFHNPTRANVGSLGMVPKVSKNSITSTEYQVWKIDKGIEAEFLATFIQTDFFLKLVHFHRVGAVKQRLYVENLLEIPIPDFSSFFQIEIKNRRETLLNKSILIQEKNTNITNLIGSYITNKISYTEFLKEVRIIDTNLL